jgi:hypothetical protein
VEIAALIFAHTGSPEVKSSFRLESSASGACPGPVAFQGRGMVISPWYGFVP